MIHGTKPSRPGVAAQKKGWLEKHEKDEKGKWLGANLYLRVPSYQYFLMFPVICV